MPFFMNPFTADFRGNLLLGDRQHIPVFICPGNKGRADDVVYSWNPGPYNMSGADVDGLARDIVLLSYSIDADFKNWAMIPVNCTTGAANIASVTTQEVVNALNADPNFSGPFGAYLESNNRVFIKQKHETSRMKFFVVNGRAEEALRFNARSGVAELPTYFRRHTIARRGDFPDSVGMLIEMNPSVLSQAAVIRNAVDLRGNTLGFDPTVVQADWQLLRGRSGIFQFTKTSGSTKIIYPAGAREGDLAMMVVDSGSGHFEMPYTLLSGDLITPP
jgi:hypothetical protein